MGWKLLQVGCGAAFSFHLQWVRSKRQRSKDKKTPIQKKRYSTCGEAMSMGVMCRNRSNRGGKFVRGRGGSDVLFPTPDLRQECFDLELK